MRGEPTLPFMLDVMLGKLAVYLRLCGYDAVYALDRDVEADEAVLELADREGRTVLTRDVHLSTRAERGVLIIKHNPPDQLAELAAVGLRLEPTAEPARCGRCNGSVEAVDEGKETPGYAPDPIKTAQ